MGTRIPNVACGDGCKHRSLKNQVAIETGPRGETGECGKEIPLYAAAAFEAGPGCCKPATGIFDRSFSADDCELDFARLSLPSTVGRPMLHDAEAKVRVKSTKTKLQLWFLD